MGDGDYVKKDCCVTMQKNKTPLQCVFFVLRGFCVHVLKLFEFLIGAAVNTDTQKKR